MQRDILRIFILLLVLRWGRRRGIIIIHSFEEFGRVRVLRANKRTYTF
jgi:hypothetical protein